MRLFQKLTAPAILPHWTQDAVLTLPRLVCGYFMAFNFGAQKFGMPWSDPDLNLGLFEVAFWFPNDVAQFGGPFALFPAFFAWMGGFSEAVGGLLLLAGLQTRVASLLICITMLVAAFCQQLQSGYWNMLPALGFAFITLYTMVLGSGRFGLDYLITKKIKK
ncbi:DoxX family protein [Flavobacterium album]|uniref:DoxX family protein n=1 Tax=Flavobacterium album TaxID=2175091 RepID=A0A2S1R177_9FLAO|nr:DoxX family membrane protein [Flavobacterium album]AWH86395.1 DoxX family protein [Flavobacterium album]